MGKTSILPREVQEQQSALQAKLNPIPNFPISTKRAKLCHMNGGQELKSQNQARIPASPALSTCLLPLPSHSLISPSCSCHWPGNSGSSRAVPAPLQSGTTGKGREIKFKSTEQLFPLPLRLITAHWGSKFSKLWSEGLLQPFVDTLDTSSLQIHVPVTVPFFEGWGKILGRI